MIRTFKDLPEIRAARVFLRLDLNVPVQGGRITDFTRIQRAMPTICALQAAGAKIIIASHIETSDVSSSGNVPTLEPVFNYFKGKFPGTVFISDYYPGPPPDAIYHSDPGGIVLLENLRKYSEEKDNDEKFAKYLASLADIYIDDAFACAHRKHASIVGIPNYIAGYAGLLMEEEVSHLAAAFNAPHPFVFVLGGAKFSTKLPLVKKFLSLADTVFVGGALGNDLLKARGFDVGASLLSENFDASDIVGSEKLVMPVDVVVENETGREIRTPDNIKKGDSIVDAGPNTIKLLERIVAPAACVLWNGPLGIFEKGYRDGTDALARTIAASKAQSIVGGGDTLATISDLNLGSKFTFVSTGGGAMLDFLANGTLPGIEALEE